MRATLLEILADPISGSPLRLREARSEDGEILEGALEGADGTRYPIRDGIPRFVRAADTGQEQVADSFAFKWSRRGGYEHPRVHALNERSELERYGLRSIEEFRAIFSSRGRVLDAGCASGHHTSVYLTPDSRPAEWVGTDISSAIDLARERLGGIPGTSFVQADIHAMPFRPASFDLILSRGVMHHTPSTEHAFDALERLLEPGGEFIFFVYRRNGPVREFTDDRIRAALAALPPDEAWEALRPLTRFGQALAQVNAQVEVPEDIPYLGIPAGRYDVHRLLYDHFVKAYWNEGWSYDENNLISFDWYHPAYAFRHTEAEVRGWCERAGLAITHFDSRWTGFTVRAIKG